MFEVVLSNRFRKDLKLAAKRGLRLDELNTIVNQLAAGQTLPERNRDHALTGDYIGFRECHIRPDWLLVYRVDGDALELFLFRTGTHTDLFDQSFQGSPTPGLLFVLPCDNRVGRPLCQLGEYGTKKASLPGWARTLEGFGCCCPISS